METIPPIQTPPTVPAGEDKTVAILSYITLLGFIAAIIIHSSKKTRLGAFHLRQVLGFFITAIAFGIGGFVLAFIPFLGPLCMFVLWIAMLVLWVMGLISAVNGQMKPLPVVGELYQKWFGTAFD